jgi:hypothetical protein
MGELTKNDLVFTRGQDGALISQEVALENIEGNPTVKIIPLTRGKLQEIYAIATNGTPEEKAKADNDVIKNGLVSPKLTEQEIEDIKPQMALAIVQSILAISLGISQKEVEAKTKEQLILQQEYQLKKK